MIHYQNVLQAMRIHASDYSENLSVGIFLRIVHVPYASVYKPFMSSALFSWRYSELRFVFWMLLTQWVVAMFDSFVIVFID